MKMPGNMGNMQAMMKQAQQMQEKLQAEIALIRVEGSAGGGMVAVKMDGHKNVIGVKIDPEVAGDVEMLQDLVLAACADAFKKVEEESQRKMGGMLGCRPVSSKPVLRKDHAGFRGTAGAAHYRIQEAAGDRAEIGAAYRFSCDAREPRGRRSISRGDSRREG